MKGIGIILVVWSHAGGPFRPYIGQFHMPLFFILSGFLHNSIISTKEFIWRKIYSLYIPFAFWNCIGMIAVQVLNIYPVSWLKFFLKFPAILLTLSKEGMLFGATWFLGALFLITIVFKVAVGFISRVNKLSDIQGEFIVSIGTFLCAALGFAVTLPFGLSRTLILSSFYGGGY